MNQTPKNIPKGDQFGENKKLTLRKFYNNRWNPVPNFECFKYMACKENSSILYGSLNIVVIQILQNIKG